MTDHKPYPEIEPVPDPPAILAPATVAVGVVGVAHVAMAAFPAEAVQAFNLGGVAHLAMAAFSSGFLQAFNLVAGLLEILIAASLAIGLSQWRTARQEWLTRQRAERAHLLKQKPTGPT